MNVSVTIPGIEPFILKAFDEKDYITQCLVKHGNWEPNVTSKILAIFRAARERDLEGIYIDVGAYIGYYPFLAARNEIPSIAFEPNPTSFELLKQNAEVAGQDKITIKNYALGATQGNRFLTVKAENLGASFIGGSEEDGVYVTVDTLDEQSITKPVLALKIDAEGSEGAVIAGAANLLKNNPPAFLIVEISPKFTPLNEIIEQIFFPLWKVGYASYDIGLQDSGNFTEALVRFFKFSDIEALTKFLINVGQTNFIFVKEQENEQDPQREIWTLELAKRWQEEYIVAAEENIKQIKNSHAETQAFISNLKRDNSHLHVKIGEAERRINELEDLLRQQQKNKNND